MKPNESFFLEETKKEGTLFCKQTTKKNYVNRKRVFSSQVKEKKKKTG
jgi:hypothetical protein